MKTTNDLNADQATSDISKWIHDLGQSLFIHLPAKIIDVFAQSVYSSVHLRGDRNIAYAAFALLALFIVIRVLRVVLPNGAGTFRGDYLDGERLFTSQQKLKALKDCGFRCEHRRYLIFRCHETQGLQGDHIYPYSKGGQTIQTNLQMLCAHHNRQKSARVPTFVERQTLQFARRFYFPSTSNRHIRWK